MQGPAYFSARGISVRVQHAAATVSGLARECQLCAVAVKLRSPFNQFVDPLHAFLHQNAGGIGIHDSVAGADGVLQMKTDFVFVAQGNGNATLRILCRRLSQFLFGQHQDFAGLSEGNSGAQTGNACTYHDEINLVWQCFHEEKMVTKAGGNAKFAITQKRAPLSVMISMSEKNQGKARYARL